MSKTKKQHQLRRAKKARRIIAKQDTPRLSVYRTPRHIYAQVFDSTGNKVLVAASTLDKEIKCDGYTGNVKAASLVGQLIAKRAKASGVTSVAFDRSGFKYHGRIKALADAAREGGIEF